MFTFPFAQLLFAGIVAVHTSSYAEIIVDQQYVPGASFNVYAGIGAADFAQTFTTLIGGTLESVSVLIERSTAAQSSDLIFDIRRTDNGLPIESNSDVLFSKTIGHDEIPLSAGLFSINLSGENIAIAPGDSLAMVLRSELLYPGNDVSYWWLGRFWSNPETDPYPGGSAHQRAPWRQDLLKYYPGYNIYTWNPNVDFYTGSGDFGFQVSVNTDTSPIPEPSTIILMLMGLAGIYSVVSRRKFTL